MRIDTGFYNPDSGTGTETLVCTPCFGQGNWSAKGGYLRLKAAGTVQVRVWFHDGNGWHNYGLAMLTRDGGCQSWQGHAATGSGGGFLVQRVRKADDAEATVPVDGCIEIIPA